MDKKQLCMNVFVCLFVCVGGCVCGCVYGWVGGCVLLSFRITTIVTNSVLLLQTLFSKRVLVEQKTLRRPL